METEKLKKSIEALEIQSKWLIAMFEKTKNINLETSLSVEDFDNFELLSIRFVRSVDFLTRKYFRVLDLIESKENKNILDVFECAVSDRELFKETKDVKLLRDIRNKVAYEVVHNDLILLFPMLIKYTPVLLKGIVKSIEYGKNILPEEENKEANNG